MDEKQPLLKNENQVDVENAGKKKNLVILYSSFHCIFMHNTVPLSMLCITKFCTQDCLVKFEKHCKVTNSVKKRSFDARISIIIHFHCVQYDRLLCVLFSLRMMTQSVYRNEKNH